jgi:hypothetical protein
MMPKYFSHVAFLIGALVLLAQLLIGCGRDCRAATDLDPAAGDSADCLAICHR